jgi:hypothetical protein
MTTLAARASGLRAKVEGRPATLPVGVRLLPVRLQEESDRQVPFSQAKLLLREAAAAIENLEAQLARVTAELEAERSARPLR